MSSNYTGDETATQSPSPPPGPDVAPIVVLPSDGDADNAASVAQAFKVLADFIAWLVAPFANIANQAQRIWAVQCARLLARGGFDHRGFPAGNLLRWSEDWNDIGAVTKTTGSGGWFGRWRWSTNAIAGLSTVDVGVPTGSADVTPWLKLSGGSGPGCAVVEMYRGQQATSGGGIDYVLEFLLRFDTINGDLSLRRDFDGTLVGLAPTSPFESINPKGIGLYFPQGGTNLLFYSNLSGTPASPIDTGVAAVINTTYRVRLEMQSPATSDNTASRFLCYINGAVVADVAPGSLPNIALTPAFLAYAATGLPGLMKIGCCGEPTRCSPATSSPRRR